MRHSTPSPSSHPSSFLWHPNENSICFCPFSLHIFKERNLNFCSTIPSSAERALRSFHQLFALPSHMQLFCYSTHTFVKTSGNIWKILVIASCNTMLKNKNGPFGFRRAIFESWSSFLRETSTKNSWHSWRTSEDNHQWQLLESFRQVNDKRMLLFLCV